MNVLERPDVLDETWLEETVCCAFDKSPASWLAGCRNCSRRVRWCERHYEITMLRDLDPANSWECRACGNYHRNWHDGSFAVQI